RARRGEPAPDLQGPDAERERQWMRMAVLALAALPDYPATVALQLTGFEQVQASVFQVARSPGKTIVYIGCLLLVLGVFSMFYIRERRVWVWIRPQDKGSAWLAAMTTQRRTLDFNLEFERLRDALRRLSGRHDHDVGFPCCARFGGLAPPHECQRRPPRAPRAARLDRLRFLLAAGSGRRARADGIRRVHGLLREADADRCGRPVQLDGLAVAAVARPDAGQRSDGAAGDLALQPHRRAAAGRPVAGRQRLPLELLDFFAIAYPLVVGPVRPGDGLLVGRLRQPHGGLAGQQPDLGGRLRGADRIAGALARSPPAGPRHRPYPRQQSLRGLRPAVPGDGAVLSVLRAPLCHARPGGIR